MGVISAIVDKLYSTAGVKRRTIACLSIYLRYERFHFLGERGE